MNILKKTTLVMAICLMSASAYSQVDLAQCHKECIIQDMEHISISDIAQYATRYSSSVCITAQELLFGLKGCFNSCKDIAQIKYGSRIGGKHLSSFEHLTRIIDRHTTLLMNAGLWVSLHNTPTIADKDITEWANACGRYISNILDINNEVNCARIPNDNYVCRR